MGLGQGVLAYIVLVLGRFKLGPTTRLCFWSLYVGGVTWAFHQWRSAGWRRLCLDAWTQVRKDKDGWRGDGLLRLLLWDRHGPQFRHVFIPEVFYDAMVYHLGILR